MNHLTNFPPRRSFLARFFDLAGNRPDNKDACWIWQGAKADRYGHMLLAGGFVKGQIKAHRTAYLLFVGPIPDRLCVLHKCDVPTCINPRHLFLGTQADNMQDKAKKGRGGTAKLKRSEVAEIRQLHAEGKHNCASLGHRFGVGPRTIRNIVNRISWTKE